MLSQDKTIPFIFDLPTIKNIYSFLFIMQIRLRSIGATLKDVFLIIIIGEITCTYFN